VTLTPNVVCAQKEAEACSDSHLSGLMPDIAMPTNSLHQMSLSDLHLAPPGPPSGDLELDLGDGNSHSGTGTLYI